MIGQRVGSGAVLFDAAQLQRVDGGVAEGGGVERGPRRIEQDPPDHASSRGGRPSDMVSTG